MEVYIILVGILEVLGGRAGRFVLKKMEILGRRRAPK